ncbi:MAG TPA: sigma-70 domain-containing protein [Lachnospiraceae bacterium]|jgi:RNA polymerase primary sigma factor|nr:sigma-70 domain-containing protein [Lachnospiraceae bacterium]
MNDRQKAALAEEFMPKAAVIAAEMDDGTIPSEDLIQEAYVGLMAGLGQVAEAEETSDGLPLTETVENAIRARIREAQEEQAALAKKDDRLIAQVELLNQSIERLTQELGTKPNIDEIANDMHISQDKVEDILKLAGEETGEHEHEEDSAHEK